MSARPPSPKLPTHPRWNEVWKDILGGGNKRWKDGEEINNFEVAYNLLVEEGVLSAASQPSSIFVPLCGDCRFVHYAHSRGNSVAGLDGVGAALETLRKQFEKGPSFERSDIKEGGVVFTGSDGRITTIQADLFTTPFITELNLERSFDLIYDKDAFGAIPPEDRAAYVKIMSRVCKAGGFVFIEGKFRKEEDPTLGPPFHLVTEEIKKQWGAEGFKVLKHYESLYPLKNPEWRQQGWLLQM